MHKFESEFFRCMVDLDTSTARQLWAHVHPELPSINTDRDMLIVLHRARTESRSIRMRDRAYSHRWCIDNGIPSGLPDHLRPRAERMYPVIVDAVGICVGARSDFFKPVSGLVHAAMVDAVEDCYANGDKDPEIVKLRMRLARETALQFAFGQGGYEKMRQEVRAKLRGNK